MFSHIFVGANDVVVSKKFYDAALGAIGIPEGKIDPKGRVFYRTPSGTFGISKPIDGKAATHAKMHDQDFLGGKIEDQIFGPSGESHHPLPLKSFAKPVGKGKTEVFSALFHPHQALAGHCGFKAAADGFYLRKFRHRQILPCAATA